MALDRVDNVGDTTTSVGTGTIELASVAQIGARIFAGNVTSGATVRYDIRSADNTEWEIGEGVFTDGTPDTLSRVTVFASSNSGALVNFSAGTKDVSLIFTAKDLDVLTPTTIELGHATDTTLSRVSAGVVAIEGNNIITSATVPVKATGAELIAGVDDAKFATALGLYGSVALGWFALGACTYEGADAPTFTFSIASDVTALISVGQRIKLTQTTVKYFIITAVGAFTAGKTIITVYGGTDYTLANAAITIPYFSTQKAPFGFPLSPIKWTVEITDVTSRTQATPTQNTWYNLGSVLISIPIGIWRINYQVALYTYVAGTTAGTTIYSTLSTANNSESDVDLTCYMSFYTVATSAEKYLMNTVNREKTLVIAAKTSYYLNTRTKDTNNASIFNANADSKLIIRATCSYI